MSPVLLHVIEDPAYLDRPMLPLYPVLPGFEKQIHLLMSSKEGTITIIIILYFHNITYYDQFIKIHNMADFYSPQLSDDPY